MPNSQRIFGSNISPDISESLEARTKDPLWFLARQWQFGEFEAETGGAPAQLSIQTIDYPVDQFTPGLGEQKSTEPVPVDLAAPLEAIIEPEDDGVSPAWNSQTLSYDGTLSVGEIALELRGYDGLHLDWHDFKVTAFKPPKRSSGQVTDFTAMPTQLSFKGAPSPRWWEIEDSGAYFDSPIDPEPNVLSMMLPEFFYTDIKNWYVMPTPMKSGHIREVSSVTIVDSFGVVTQIEAAIDEADPDWSIFTLSGPAFETEFVSGRFFFAPNIALTVLNNDVCEEVRFSRDEDANLVWAWERVLTDEDGQTYSTNLDRPEDLLDVSEPGQYYTLKSNTARSWIPYVPRHTADVPAVDGDITLRRARTDQAATPDNPQYRSQIVGESKYVHEEQIPPNGLRLRRVHQFARGSDGTPHFWIGRDREVTPLSQRPNLKFDFVRKVDG